MKRCKTCEIDRPETDFYKANSRTTSFTECKPCSRDRARANMRAKRAADPDSWRGPTYKAVYGIDLETYDIILAAQNGGCAICGATTSGVTTKPRLYIDHNHENGKIRGLLCHGCNAGLGCFRDDSDRLTAALAYLIHSKTWEWTPPFHHLRRLREGSPDPMDG